MTLAFDIEDETDSRDLVVQMLETRGAIPDRIVSDIGLPGTDGFQRMRAIRERTGRRH